MIIGVDASKAAVKNKTGVENYVYYLLLALKSNDQKNTYYLYTNKQLPSELKGGNFVEKLVPAKIFWNKVRLPLAIINDRPDIFFSPAYSLPPFAPKRSAATFHDLAWIKFPQAYTKKQLFLQRLYMKSLKRSKVVFTVSQSAAKDLENYFRKPTFKIVPIPIAGSVLKPITNPKDIFSFGNTPYFLSVGRLEERKNTLNIIKAFIALRETGIESKLVLAGKPGYGYDKIIYEINNSKYKKDIVLAGFLKQEEINDVFSNAIAVVYPSLYEGFGLTAHEAMSAGTPVITSNISSLPEVVGNAALLVDPTKTEDIAEAMNRVITDKSLRQNLISEGLKQAEKFSWDRTAKETLKVLEEL